MEYRLFQEELEEKILSPLAAKSAASKGGCAQRKSAISARIFSGTEIVLYTARPFGA